MLAGLEIPRELRGLFTRDLRPELAEHYARLAQEIDRVIDDPSTRPNLEHVDEVTSEQGLIDAVATVAAIDRQQALSSIMAVLEVLRDRIDYRECERIALALPPPLRRWIVKPRRQGKLRLSREEFVDRVCRHLSVDVRQALLRIRAVYGALERALSQLAPDEPMRLMVSIPRDLQKVLKFPSPVAAAEAQPQAP